jgi:type IV pilus assembly protein PilW
MKCKDYLNTKGVTLIELLVVLVLSGLVIAGIYRLFVAQSRAYTVQDQVAEVQQSIRSAMEILLRDLRMAGFDSDDINSKITVANPVIADDHSVTVSYEYDNTTQHTVVYQRDAGTLRMTRQLTATKNDGTVIAGPQEVILENVDAFDFNFAVDTNGDGAMDDYKGNKWVTASTVNADGLKVVAVHVHLVARPTQVNPDLQKVTPRALDSAITLRNLCFAK